MASDIYFGQPKEFRHAVREGRWNKPTPSQCPGFVQANLVIIPYKWAFDFIGFCLRNPKPCPILEILEPGNYKTKISAEGADIRTDCPKYKVFQGDKVQERHKILDIWRDDLVTFLLGCSFTFDSILLKAQIPIRHIEEDKNVPMYVTNINCNEFGTFRGPLVVSMRPIPGNLIPKVVELSGEYPLAHGAPVHVGDPLVLGIKDINQPDFGDRVNIYPGEIPVFWACGVTPQMAIRYSGIDFAVTHAPGHMFVTDLKVEEIRGKANLAF